MEDKKQTIIQYLSGRRDYWQGVELYRIYGINLMLKRRFQMARHTPALEQLLFDELRKIAGVTASELQNLQRIAPAVSIVPKTEPEPQKQTATPVVAEEIVERIRFRDRFPFLSDPSCPDALKIMVNDMLTAHENFAKAHTEMVTLDDGADASSLAETIVENYIANAEMWEEIKYYQEHGRILGKAEFFQKLSRAQELSDLTDMELRSRITNARSNISKAKKKGDTEGVSKWMSAKEEAEAEQKRRINTLNNDGE